jgi:hypothetical protein
MRLEIETSPDGTASPYWKLQVLEALIKVLDDIGCLESYTLRIDELYPIIRKKGG